MQLIKHIKHDILKKTFFKVITAFIALSAIPLPIKATETDSQTKVTPTFLDHAPLNCLIEPNRIISVGSPSTGIIDYIPVKRGDTISEGALLAQLDNSLEKNAILVARERFQFLKSQYQRALELRAKAMATPESFDQAQTEMAIAELELKRRQLQLDQKEIKSPVRGVVLQQLLAPGEYAYEQTPLIKIAQTDPLNAEVIAPITLYNQVHLSQSAQIKITDPINQEFIANVEVIDKVFDTASQTFGIRLSLPNPDLSLPAGLECQVRFIANP